MNGIPTIDMSLALQQAGGSRELAEELFGMLLRELPMFERGIRAAFERSDLETLQRAVHKLHGAAIYCGVPALRHAAETLERALKRGETDRLEDQVVQLVDQIQRVQAIARERMPPAAAAG
jgi:two-component system sensor histidine kinase BarA